MPVRDYSWALANGAELPEEGLLAVFRFTDHADPMYCQCGHTWGHHGRFGRTVRVPGPKLGDPSRDCYTMKTDCEGGDGPKDAPCKCMEFRYDTSCPWNKVKRDFSGYTDFPS